MSELTEPQLRACRSIAGGWVYEGSCTGTIYGAHDGVVRRLLSRDLAERAPNRHFRLTDRGREVLADA